jgi:hypothetical protein
MTKTIAILALLVISIGLVWGNYWFTFGLWPRSWTAFALFGFAQLVVTALMQAVTKSKD